MELTKTKNGSELTVALSGRLDTMTAPQAEEELNGELDGITSLTLDLKDLSYLSSAGLRLLLKLQKTMSKQGKMEVHHANDTIMEIFEMTGFSDILTIVNE